MVVLLSKIQVYREGSSRYIGIGFNIRGKDLGSAIAEAQKKGNDRTITKFQQYLHKMILWLLIVFPVSTTTI